MHPIAMMPMKQTRTIRLESMSGSPCGDDALLDVTEVVGQAAKAPEGRVAPPSEAAFKKPIRKAGRQEKKAKSRVSPARAAFFLLSCFPNSLSSERRVAHG
jgi:hypothetical protein